MLLSPALTAACAGEQRLEERPYRGPHFRAREDSADSSSSSNDRRRSAVWYDGDEEGSDNR